MIYSEIAISILALKECGVLKTNAQFWKQIKSKENIIEYCNSNEIISNKVEELKLIFDSNEDFDSGIICVFDDDFPCINNKAKDSEKPYLLFYKGNKSLLEDLNKNVAVIGLTDPTEEIKEREKHIVEKLIENKQVIVSGLAKGCDEIAHRICVENNSSTIAVLPTSLEKIAPASNRQLAQEIVESNGLLITEYYKEAASRNEAIGRYVERDRLQALFSKAVIMIASYKKGEGDSGSRHAMTYAEKYQINRYIMYDEKRDANDKQFGLSREFSMIGVESLSPSHIEKLSDLKNFNLNRKSPIFEQGTFLQ